MKTTTEDHSIPDLTEQEMLALRGGQEKADASLDIDLVLKGSDGLSAGISVGANGTVIET